MKKFTYLSIIVLIMFISACSKSSKPLSGKNEIVEANYENCKKVDGLSNGYVERVAELLSVPMASIKYKRIECKQEKGDLPIVIVDTAIGPKRCMVPSILWLKDGSYVAFEYIQLDSGKLFLGLGNKSACELF